MSDNLVAPTKPLPPATSTADKQAFARVETWMEMIRLISRDQQKQH